RRAGVGKAVDGDNGTPEADLVAMARCQEPVGLFCLLGKRRLMETRQNPRPSEGCSRDQKAPAFHRGHSPFDGFPIPPSCSTWDRGRQVRRFASRIRPIALLLKVNPSNRMHAVEPGWSLP